MVKGCTRTLVGSTRYSLALLLETLDVLEEKVVSLACLVVTRGSEYSHGRAKRRLRRACRRLLCLSCSTLHPSTSILSTTVNSLLRRCRQSHPRTEMHRHDYLRIPASQIALPVLPVPRHERQKRRLFKRHTLLHNMRAGWYHPESLMPSPLAVTIYARSYACSRVGALDVLAPGRRPDEGAAGKARVLSGAVDMPKRYGWKSVVDYEDVGWW